MGEHGRRMKLGRAVDGGEVWATVVLGEECRR
jgi:hypothetical protein